MNSAFLFLKMVNSSFQVLQIGSYDPERTVFEELKS